MPTQLDVFHGCNGDNILGIIRDGFMRPNERHECYFSYQVSDVFMHGGDVERKAAFAFKARITLPARASWRRESRPGNAIAIIVTSVMPIPTEILELYVRHSLSEPPLILREIAAIKGEILRRAD